MMRRIYQPATVRALEVIVKFIYYFLNRLDMSYHLSILPFIGVSFFVFAIITYVYMAFALMTIANKTNTPNAWLAWIPIVNLYLITQIAQVPWWTLFVIFLGFIPIIGTLAVIAVMMWWWWKIAEARNKPGWYGILIAIPIVNIIIIGLIAWQD